MRLTAVALLASLVLVGPAVAGELVTLTPRPGVTQSYLLVPPDGPIRAAAVLLPGGQGDIRLRLVDGQIRFVGGSFIVRARGHLAGRGVVGAMLDAPSDQPGGMTDSYRRGAEHVADLRAVIADLKRRVGDLPVFLAGTSRSTISAAHAGRALGGEIAGVVLTATMFYMGGNRPYEVLSGFDFSAIKAPLLFVHHRDDACFATPYRDAARLADRFALVSVRGGLPAESEPCEARSAHGFFGREKATADAIARWMLGQPFAREIE